MTIIYGADNFNYMVLNGKLLRIVNENRSAGYYTQTGGYVEYVLEDGSMVREENQ